MSEDGSVPLSGRDGNSKWFGVEADIVWVFFCGLVGGLMLWVWQQMKLGEDAPGFLHLLAFMLLGAGSAVVVVFLVFNVDRRDKPRLFALGIVGGFAFAYVLEAGLPTWFSQTQASAARSVAHAVAPRIELTGRPGTLDRALAEKAAEPETVANEPEGAADDISSAELVDAIFDTYLRVNEGVGETRVLAETVALDTGTWVEVDTEAGARQVERRIRVPDGGGRRTVVRARPRDDTIQDLMAVLLGLDDGGLLEQIAFDDDTGQGSLNPRIEAVLAGGDYLLRVLPFDDGEIGAVEVLIEFEEDTESQ